MNLSAYDPGSGPRTNTADGRTFYWVKEGRSAVRCWLTTAEERRLFKVFDLLEDRDPQTEMRARYHDLNSEMINLFNKMRRYRWGINVAGDLESIRGLETLIIGGANIDLKDHRYEITNELIGGLPKLRGNVEEFCRDLQSAILNLPAGRES